MGEARAHAITGRRRVIQEGAENKNGFRSNARVVESGKMQP